MASIFSAKEEVRSSCEGGMDSFPGWGIQRAGLGEMGKDPGDRTAVTLLHMVIGR